MTNLYYCYDALCGWCYGFSPTMTAFAERYADEISLEVLAGGMITGERIGPIGEVAGYIKWAYREVEDRCAVEFGRPFLDGVLEEGSAVFTSLPAAYALAVVKDQKPEQQLDFAADLQTAIYYDGIQPADLSEYGPRAAAFGFDAERFVADMQLPKYQKLAQRDFRRSGAFGVTGFPTLIAEGPDGRFYALARGYAPLETLEQNWTRFHEVAAG